MRKILLVGIESKLEPFSCFLHLRLPLLWVTLAHKTHQIFIQYHVSHLVKEKNEKEIESRSWVLFSTLTLRLVWGYLRRVVMGTFMPKTMIRAKHPSRCYIANFRQAPSRQPVWELLRFSSNSVKIPSLRHSYKMWFKSPFPPCVEQSCHLLLLLLQALQQNHKHLVVLPSSLACPATWLDADDTTRLNGGHFLAADNVSTYGKKGGVQGETRSKVWHLCVIKLGNEW